MIIRMVKNLFNSLQQYDFYKSLRHTINYFGAVLAVQVLAIFSLPIYTFFFTPEDFGIVNIFLSTATMLFILFPLNLHSSIARYYYEEKGDYKDYLGTVFILMGLSFCILAPVLFLFRETVAEWIGIPSKLIFWVILFALGEIIWRSYEFLFMAAEKSGEVSKNKVIVAYAKFGLSVLFILYLVAVDDRYYGRVIGETVIMLLMIAYFIKRLKPHVTFNVKKQHIRYAFYISLPLLPHSLSSFIITFFDQLFISSTIGNYETGIYSFAYKLAMILIGFNQAIIGGSTPDFYKKLNRGKTDELDGQVKSILKFMLLATAFLMFFSKEMVMILAQKVEFYEALPLVPVLVFAFFLYGIYIVHSRIVVYSKHNIYLSITTIVGGIFNLILNSIYIPIYGYEAAVYTTLVSYVVMLSLVWLLCKVVLKTYLPPVGIVFTYIGYAFVLMLFALNFTTYIAVHFLVELIIKGSIFLILGFILFGDKIKLQFSRMRGKKENKPPTD